MEVCARQKEVTLNTIDEPWKLRAIEVAQRSKCATKMGAVIVKHGAILGESCNYDYEKRGVHAEFGAISNALQRGLQPKDLWGASIFIAGLVESGNFVRTAAPCRKLKRRSQNHGQIPCRSLLRKHGIDKIFFIRKDGSWDFFC